VNHIDNTSEILRLLEQAQALKKYRQIDSYFPAEGPLRRELYPQHLEFFHLGATHRERLFLAANRIGKTNAGAYEIACHLTGQYPTWWTGKRFNTPISAWAAGDTSKTCRDIVQLALLGSAHDQGTGMIPRDAIVRVTTKTGIADAIETVYVRHVTGGISELGLKSYDQGRDSFVGTAKHVCWLDEECDNSIYVESLLRTMTTGGLVYLTATPLLGMTDVIMSFVQPQEETNKIYVQCDWNQVPHLSDEAKAQLLASIPEYQRQARSRGIPALGAGTIYQVAESDLLVADFPIPDYWPRVFSLDVGWRRTACLWGARDPETKTIYLYSEYYVGQKEPSLHAEAIRARGTWISGVCDPAAQGRSQVDGTQLIELYRSYGLDLSPAINAVESGIYAVWQLMSAGKLKVFQSLTNWLSEFRLYHRDETGTIVKQHDHLMDCVRYLVVSGLEKMRTKPKQETQQQQYVYPGQNSQRWMM